MLIVASACAVGEFVIGLMLMSVRAQMAGRPIDELAIDDPLRVQFNTLHEYSVWVLLAGIAAALIVFFIIASRNFVPSKDSASSDPYNFEKEFKI
ncbi:hypothetical protein [Leptolyngbya sp. 7M]|uniref:hypothetical protein n=1 Tax=Leptolyngbya sp. 7M TaxID=2812896 RepID=UPI001B8C1A2F|nr:hypothetical protein [Leptolyngbya sp. 7M]QYO66090.1 hypothetical protein JVX88_04630 [Leptolyngbya sp. 7M]